jgi:hypothetical protein
MRKIVHWLILVVLVYSIIEFISCGGLYYLKIIKKINYNPVNVISDKNRDIIDTFLLQQTNYLIFSETLG